jgi:uncharacterized RDD family membrane protein YckC
MPENPYQSPVEVGYEVPAVVHQVGQLSGGRFMAAQIDHAFAVVLFFIVIMNSPAAFGNVGASLAALAAYLGYYFVPEWLVGSTIGKSLFALKVRQSSGAPCTARQAAVRTAMRLVEVNPMLLGGIPAGIAIFTTKRRQRIGDLLAGTVVLKATSAGPGSGPRIEVVRRGKTTPAEQT